MRPGPWALFLVLLTALPAWGARVVVDWEYDYVNVRSGPDTERSQVGRLTTGAEAELLEEDGEWSRIRYSGGEGWVVSRSLVAAPEPLAPTLPPSPASPPDAPPSPTTEPARGETGQRGADTPAEEPRDGTDGYLSRYMDDAEVPELDPGSNLLSMLSGLLIVLALVGGAAYVARRFFGRRLTADRRGTSIQILSSRPLGPRTSLLLVETGGLVWLLSQGPEGVVPIAEINDAAALSRLNDRYGFLETPFEGELRQRLDLESGAPPDETHGRDSAPREPSPEERLAALRGRPRSGDAP